MTQAAILSSQDPMVTHLKVLLGLFLNAWTMRKSVLVFVNRRLCVFFVKFVLSMCHRERKVVDNTPQIEGHIVYAICGNYYTCMVHVYDYCVGQSFHLNSEILDV